MYNENSAPEVVPSQKEVALHHVHMEPVPMAYSQERMASPPHSAYPRRRSPGIRTRTGNRRFTRRDRNRRRREQPGRRYAD
ncbi:hypothetical protein PG995_006804 [Apiospora arundinis]